MSILKFRQEVFHITQNVTGSFYIHGSKNEKKKDKEMAANPFSAYPCEAACAYQDGVYYASRKYMLHTDIPFVDFIRLGNLRNISQGFKS